MEISVFRDKIARMDRVRVRYVPGHAYGDKHHPDCEDGVISSVSEYTVFVKFNKYILRMGFDQVTAQACSPEDLVLL